MSGIKSGQFFPFPAAQSAGAEKGGHGIIDRLEQRRKVIMIGIGSAAGRGLLGIDPGIDFLQPVCGNVTVRIDEQKKITPACFIPVLRAAPAPYFAG